MLLNLFTGGLAGFYLFVIIAAAAGVFIHARIKGEPPVKTLCSDVWKLIVIGGAVRLICARLPWQFETDMNCFMAWGETVLKGGFANFYISEGFHDYPPGYMYPLALTALVRNITGMEYFGPAHGALVKLIPMAADVAASVFLYKLASGRLGPKKAFAVGLLYALNPASVIISACWGQADSVHTLLLLVSIYYLSKGRRQAAFALFGAGVLIKPQTLVFTPLYLFYAYDYVRARKFNAGAFWDIIKPASVAAAGMFALILPFAMPPAGLRPVLEQYFYSVAKQYPYATVNGYNVWALLGLNWGALSEKVWNMPVSAWSGIATAVIAVYAFVILNRKKEAPDYFAAAAFMNLCVFMFMARMHERYVFSSMALFLAAHAQSGKKAEKWSFLIVSACFFLNAFDVLRLYQQTPADYASIAVTSRVISLAFVTGFAFIAFCFIKGNRPKRAGRRYIFAPDSTEPAPVFSKTDFIALSLITLAYAAFAFTNAGDTKAPQTMWAAEPGQSAVITLPPGAVTRVQYYGGYDIGKNFHIEFSPDGGNWESRIDASVESVFCWREIDVPNVYARFARVTADSERTVIGEIAFRGAGGALIPGNTPEDPALTDEADRVPIAADWRNGTYFDEIYHPRSAYEYLNGITPIYEWTHPPLGKLIMAAGIKMFGMTPFGWRFMGILFGVLMTPLMYWFAKLVLRETPWAAAAAFIFSFDFMHYSQTRLATIDTYVVFFIIGMFAFMYRYYTMSFYDVPLKKTFVPLGLAGLCFGLGVSCKWPGLYAGAGLAALFLVTLAKRYMEYKRAKRKGFWEKTGKTVLFCLAAFVAVPAVIYTASFIPLCAPDNPGLAAFLKAVWSQQESMWTYHSQTVLNAEHGFSSSWWEWVLDLRPIWYYSRDLGGGIKEGISSFNNPAAALGGLAAMCYGLKASLKKNDRTWNFIIAGYLAQLLPWVFVPRLTFAYHYFPALPFLALAVGYALKNAPLKPGRKKAAALVMACAAAVMFAVYYPVLTGTPVSEAYVLKFLKLPLIGARWQLI